MKKAYICYGARTPFGKYAGILSSMRPDDLAAMNMRYVLEASGLEKDSIIDIDEVILGNANQAGEDNRNIARMALLLAGMPVSVPGITVNRLCASGLDAIAMAARMIKADEADLILAGGVESMSRAPFVLGKAGSAFSRKAEIYDTTIGWRFVNTIMQKHFGIDSMPETAENVAHDFDINRQDQDAFALRSQMRTAQAKKALYFQDEIMPVSIPSRKQREAVIVEEDEHPRADTSLEKLSALATPFKENGTVTAGNSSGVNDGSCVMIVASEKAVLKYNALTPIAEIAAATSVGVQPRIMGIAPVRAIQKLLALSRLPLRAIDVLELNEAFAAQAIAVLRQLKMPDDSEKVNPNGGAIAIGHPLGASGARLVLTLARNIQRNDFKYGIASMCVGVGQGTALLLKKALMK